MTTFDRLLPPLATLVPFEAAFRHRNFSRAADELHLSQASISRRIRELEADLGVSLFDRHRYDVAPTAEAETLAASVRLSLSELASAADRLRRRASGASSLTVLSSLSLTSVLVAPAVGGLQRAHPGLNVRVVSSCEPIDATREEFDIAVQYGPRDSTFFTVERIADEAVFPVCAPRFAAQLSPPITPDQLARLPLLHVEYDDPSWTTWRTFLAATAPDEPEVDLKRVFTSYQVCLDVAEQGGGVALGWERSVKPRLDAGTLVRIPGITIPDAAMINAYLPDHITPNRHASELLNLLKKELADQ